MQILPLNNYNYQSKLQNNKQNVNFGAIHPHTTNAATASSTLADTTNEAVLPNKATLQAWLTIVKQRILDIRKKVTEKILDPKEAEIRLQRLEMQETQLSQKIESMDE